MGSLECRDQKDTEKTVIVKGRRVGSEEERSKYRADPGRVETPEFSEFIGGGRVEDR
jgi:hypothetical protein